MRSNEAGGTARVPASIDHSGSGGAEDAEEIIFDERAGRPSFALGRGKKPQGTGVMRVLAIEQGNQDIGIQ